MRELRQRFWLKFSTWITLSACFCVLTGAALFAGNLNRLLTLWGDDIQITAYLAPEITDAQVQEIQAKLKSDSRAGQVDFVGREQALKDFRTQMASYAPDLASDKDLLSAIPSSFQISLASIISPEQHLQTVESLAADLHNIAGIEEVRFGQEWVKKYSAIIGTVQKTFGVVGLVLLLAAFFVIGNAVRAAIEGRRNEIEVYELVGATPWMIRKPFLIEGALLGTAGAATSLAVMALLFGNVKSLVAQQMESSVMASQLSFLAPAEMIYFVGTGALLGFFASYLCLRKINTGFAAAGRHD